MGWAGARSARRPCPPRIRWRPGGNSEARCSRPSRPPGRSCGGSGATCWCQVCRRAWLGGDGPPGWFDGCPGATSPGRQRCFGPPSGHPRSVPHYSLKPGRALPPVTVGPGESGRCQGLRPAAPPVLRYAGEARGTPGGSTAGTRPVLPDTGGEGDRTAGTAPVLRFAGGQPPSTPATGPGPTPAPARPAPAEQSHRRSRSGRIRKRRPRRPRAATRPEPPRPALGRTPVTVDDQERLGIRGSIRTRYLGALPSATECHPRGPAAATAPHRSRCKRRSGSRPDLDGAAWRQPLVDRRDGAVRGVGAAGRRPGGRRVLVAGRRDQSCVSPDPFQP